MNDDDDDTYFDAWEDEPCDHDDFDVDILSGRAHCYRCGEAWWLSSEELKQELRLFAMRCEAAEPTS